MSYNFSYFLPVFLKKALNRRIYGNATTHISIAAVIQNVLSSQ